MTPASAVRAIAMSFPEAMEKPHFDRASFRVRNKIFATLAEDKALAVVKLSVADQTALVGTTPAVFHLVGWSHQGWTGVHLGAIDEVSLRGVLETAWCNVAPKKLVAAYRAGSESR